MESFTTSRIIPATPQHIYECWLDADNHSEMTGANASSDSKVGGGFTAWDGYIEGTHVELKPGKRIVQRWRTLEFPVEAPDSLLEIVLEPSNGGTLLTINHSELPDGQGDSYKMGWAENYFDPMTTYFRTVY
jgi:uncharacterized protein YndB with AHSA1/START domain